LAIELKRGGVTSDARALLDELTGKFLQQPQNVSVGEIKVGTIVNADGQPLGRPDVDIKQLLLPPPLR
jgi:hypothetical protein